MDELNLFHIKKMDAELEKHLDVVTDAYSEQEQRQTLPVKTPPKYVEIGVLIATGKITWKGNTNNPHGYDYVFDGETFKTPKELAKYLYDNGTITDKTSANKYISYFSKKSYKNQHYETMRRPTRVNAIYNECIRLGLKDEMTFEFLEIHKYKNR